VLWLHTPETETMTPVEPAATVPQVAAEMPDLTGHLTIETDPPDAICEIDGVALPGPSPFVATGLSLGAHEISVHRDGHVAWTRVVDVPDDQLHLPITLQAVASAADRDDAKVPAGDEVAVKGPLDKDVIRRVVRSHIVDVRRCYNQALVADPSLEGRVVVQFTIGPSGNVPVAVVGESTLGNTGVHRCIVNAVERWSFPQPEGGGNVVVSYPFVLQPK
jgi:TonB family protein